MGQSIIIVVHPNWNYIPTLRLNSRPLSSLNSIYIPTLCLNSRPLSSLTSINIPNLSHISNSKWLSQMPQGMALRNTGVGKFCSKININNPMWILYIIQILTNMGIYISIILNYVTYLNIWIHVEIYGKIYILCMGTIYY